MILRLADVLLRWSLPPGERGRGIREDLQQEMEELRDGPMGRLSSVWYLVEATKLALHFTLFRLRRSGSAGLPGKPTASIVPAFLYDVRHTLRSLRKSPGFFATVLLIFALGIGANTIIFSVVNSVLLSPLPYPDQGRLIIPYQTHPHWRDGDNPVLQAQWDRFGMSYPVYEDWLEKSPVFQNVGIHYWMAHIATGGEEAERIIGTRATFGVFRALGVEPRLGRTFLPEEDRIGGPRLVVLSHGLWRQRFGSDPGVLGQSMILDEEPYTIVGVMPQGFYFPDDSRQLWTTFPDSDRVRGRNNQFAQTIARLKPGITLEVAQREMETLAEHLKEIHPIPGRDYGVNLKYLKDEVVREARPALLLLLSSVGVFLLIACANVASLLLLRASERKREMAVRRSLGAGRGRIISQLLTEGLVLSLLGGGLGLFLTMVGLGPLVALLPPGTPRVGEIVLDQRVLLFSGSLSMVVGVLVSVLPGLVVSGAEVNKGLRDSGRGSTGGRERTRPQAVLLVSEIALTFTLLVGAGLLGKSFSRLMSVERGFSAEGIITFRVDMRGARYDSAGVRRLAHEELYQRLEAIPGVTHVAAASPGPFSGMPSNRTTVDTRDGPVFTNTQQEWTTPAYFTTMGIPLVAGRMFSPEEMEGGTGVILVNQALAETFWPGENPLDQRLKLGSPESDAEWLRVIGVVGNVRRRLDAEPFQTVTRPLANRIPIVVLKTALDPDLIMGQTREAVAAVDPNAPIVRMTTLESDIDRSVAAPRVRTVLLGAFSFFAAVLAVVGIFGVLSYAVNRRTNEIGIRMALGAERGDVLGGVLKRGLVLLALGLAMGLPVTLLVVRAVEPFLFQVSGTDGSTLLGVAVLLSLAALGASVLPAKRATRVDPVEALRRD